MPRRLFDMQALPATDIGLSLLPDPHDIARCQLTLPTGTQTAPLEGRLLEAFVVTRQHCLALLSDDVMFEERLHVYLLDADGAVLDEAHLGALYTAAVFTDLTLTPPDTLHFRFFGGDDAWRLTVFAKPRTSLLPQIGSPRLVKRPWQRTRYFSLDPARAA